MASSPPTAERIDFEESVKRVILAIPRGDVVTYGEVAAEAGFPGAARAVGRVLRVSDGLPWWRVVTASGRLVPGLESKHASLLASEGIHTDGAKVRTEPPS